MQRLRRCDEQAFNSSWETVYCYLTNYLTEQGDSFDLFVQTPVFDLVCVSQHPSQTDVVVHKRKFVESAADAESAELLQPDKKLKLRAPDTKLELRAPDGTGIKRKAAESVVPRSQPHTLLGRVGNLEQVNVDSL